jgi:pilus assembly protein CpaF
LPINDNRPQSGLEKRLSMVNPEQAANGPGYEELRDAIRLLAQERIQLLLGANVAGPAARSRAQTIVLELIEGQGAHMNKPMQLCLAEELVDDLLGYGPLESLMHDPEITEIKVLRWDHVRVEKFGVEKRINNKFRDEGHCKNVLDRLLAPTGRSISYSDPRVGARLADGSRMMAHIPPVAVNGADFSIRRFTKGLTPEILIEKMMFPKEVMNFVQACVEGALNIVVTGGTSSGKTTVLNAITSFIPETESIITIEDPAEMILQHGNVRSWEAKPANAEGKGEVTMRDLLADALRAAPKRIIVGECRKGEAFDMMQAMNTGHDGSLTTLHSNSAEDGMSNRLPNMIQMADMGLPFESIVRMIASSVDVVIHIEKDRDGVRRMVHIVQVAGVKKDEASGSVVVDTERLFEYDYNLKDWAKQKVPFRYIDRLLRRNVVMEWE